MHQIGTYIGLIATLAVLGAQTVSGQNASSAPSTPTATPPQPVPGEAPVRIGNRLDRVEPGASSRLPRPAGAVSENLTEEQRAKLKEANDKLREQQQPLYTKMRDIRAEVAALEKAEPLDENKIREKAKELGAVEGELAVLRAKHFQTIKAHLPKEQVERLREGPGARFAPGGGEPVVRPYLGGARSGIPGEGKPTNAPAPQRKTAPPNP